MKKLETKILGKLNSLLCILLVGHYVALKYLDDFICMVSYQAIVYYNHTHYVFQII